YTTLFRSDPRVRQAINHAVNVSEILRTVWNGRGVLAAGSIPPTLGGSDPSRRPYSYDTTEARRLLRAAGYPKGFPLQLWRSGTNVEMGRVAQAIQAQLAALGIQIEIVSRDAASTREAVRKGDTDMASTDWWADYPDADNFHAVRCPGCRISLIERPARRCRRRDGRGAGRFRHDRPVAGRAASRRADCGAIRPLSLGCRPRRPGSLLHHAASRAR